MMRWRTYPFPIPSLEQMINKASRANFIMTLDLVKGFHQTPVQEHKTSFSLPWGKWEYTRMPFGIKNGPSLYNE